MAAQNRMKEFESRSPLLSSHHSEYSVASCAATSYIQVTEIYWEGTHVSLDWHVVLFEKPQGTWGTSSSEGCRSPIQFVSCLSPGCSLTFSTVFLSAKSHVMTSCPLCTLGAPLRSVCVRRTRLTNAQQMVPQTQTSPPPWYLPTLF